MAEEKKRKRGRPPKKISAEGNPTLTAISTLGKVLIDTLNEKDPASLEVFERYTHILQNKIQNRAQNFPDLICKGYQLLCAELKK